MLTDLPSASIMTPEAAILVGESFPVPASRPAGAQNRNVLDGQWVAEN